MKIIRTTIAFFQALIPLLGFGLISLVTYSEFKWPFNIILAIAILVFGLYASSFVFNMVRRRGVIAVMSEQEFSTPHLQEQPLR